MKKQPFTLMLAILLMLAISACSGDKAEPVEATVPVKEMVDKMLTDIQQPKLMELDDETVKQQYHLDPALLEEYSVRIPLMNVKSNEISVLKVKDAKDLPAVEEAVKQRAADVQKSFEQYLPDQYENAKNYKLVTKGNYVLFVISEEADALVKSFESFFVQK
ncbi:DUF4358 domain-containing protein [Paenibacillus dakarensis]|uniref:DUF4358 domain-containing protein n=1 Tax=Paenibacillus dakarensis TaxID=1527293 RepID=UPI0006D544AC|nr:DUF4358 domain-containing protein [Paenibacillus dakarensis]